MSWRGRALDGPPPLRQLLRGLVAPRPLGSVGSHLGSPAALPQRAVGLAHCVCSVRQLPESVLVSLFFLYRGRGKCLLLFDTFW